MNDSDVYSAIATAQSTVFRAARAVSVRFVAANMQTEVRHLLGEVPDGVVTIYCGGHVQPEPGVQWTKELAYVRCDTANALATLLFVVLREVPRDVNS